jgi:acyl-CoA synthetase (AMP-forming)/AMP-acid ligase II
MTMRKLAGTYVRPELVRQWYEQGRYGRETLASAITKGARLHGDSRVVFHSASRSARSTLAEMDAASRRIAGAFHALGLRQGDVVAIQVPNWLEGLLTFQAAAQIGAVVVPIIHIYGPREVSFILRSSGAKFFVMPDRWRNIDYIERLAKTDLAAVERVVVIGDEAPPGAISWREVTALARDEFPASTAEPDDVALLVYTSGTTADPKGVLHSHNSLIAANRMYELLDGTDATTVTLAPWPAGHIGGFLNLLRLYLTGSGTVLMDAWDADAAVRLIGEYGVTQTSGAPYFLSTLLEATRKAGGDLTGIRRYLVGGASVPPTLVERADSFGLPACRSYGSSEVATIASGHRGDPLEKRAWTDGRATPFSQLRIVDEDGRELPRGEEGEVASICPQMFLGYSDPRLNADAFTDDGWFRTGDIGRLDADGFLTITDRKKDIIIRGGENISSKEVEDVLAAHPSVFESAVTAMPDPDMGEKVCAFVITRPECAITLEEVRRHFVAAGVARQKTPERIILVQDFPRTAAGKVKKFELRQQLRATAAA